MGQTPLEALEAYRSQHSELADLPMTYAGRLDPMAEGLLLVLAGETVHQKDDFLKLDKKYEAEILFGFSSDTYDALGLPQTNHEFPTLEERTIKIELHKFIGTNQLPIPSYSSKPVAGKPMFEWAKAKQLSQIYVPNQNSQIFEADLVRLQNLPWSEVYNYITQTIPKVTGQFRQTEILEKWHNINSDLDKLAPHLTVQTAQVNFYCSSGTYIRSLAVELGNKLGVPSLLLKLKRTSVGPYNFAD